MKTKRSKNNPVNCFCRWESLPKNTSRRRSMICLLNMKGHGCCAPFLLADPSLWLRYPSAHLLTTKQFTGLFCLTSKALLGFKSLPITKNNLHTIRYVGCFGADEGTWTPTSKTLDPNGYIAYVKELYFFCICHFLSNIQKSNINMEKLPQIYKHLHQKHCYLSNYMI